MANERFDLLDRVPLRASRWRRVWAWMRSYGAGMGCLVLVFVVMAKPFFSAQTKSNQVTCLSSIKQIGLSALLYAQDFNDTLMPAGEWMDAVGPYAGKVELQGCPEVDNAGSPLMGYAFSRVLSTRRLEHIPVPAFTPMIYESDPPVWNSTDRVTSLPIPGRHLAGNNICFSDGHAKLRRAATPLDPLPKSP